MGKERLSVHLRQSLVCDRGEETELLTYQDITDDLQVRGVVVLLRSQRWNTCGNIFCESIYWMENCWNAEKLRLHWISLYFQMDITMLADDIMESSADRFKQEAMETQIDSGKLGISSDVRLLTSYLGEVER